MKEQDRGVRWFNTRFYPHYCTGRAARYEVAVLPRLRQEAVTLFTPWGPRYDYADRGTRIRPGDKELTALAFLAHIWNRFGRCMPYKSWRWLFLGADIYGSRINSLPAPAVDEYFASFREHLAGLIPQAEFRLWSEFDPAASVLRADIAANFQQYFPPWLEAKAATTARNMGLGADHRPYLIERLTEATLIEQQFSPIKVSAVARHKDDHVDGELPRLYLVPPELQRPWMG
ncbi:MAG: hypothetical protein A3J07_04800 [Candidatus Doudnabacteria bacterium RIFCSPLOWO2_02_FULL_49_13]|uniref:Uncharacterized protein n=1 Tax=Candidatus Doudnabacteria bacterium RIFCSPHIGHO2_12_FULL_48_16 TaxID=1817838 RepID=A0A1F5PJV6_9BACT|nr:MAG: hypothetical protein A3B77_01600 [Candidatus Doudnabacteria bacterium RIFCSPHIGHO2_02_FULL_49_24]OGE89855.1 MAG: hypothetical protein A2760_03680 [Candidatus Doudnabacteria bacterium RIFCSPHIGHO2_01_FULL_50_67]OGE90223.1 MAG: hypothetical protein A3E29_03940 [Candidatus Doudnabacteria bacterium RIFCSPHIGHO2_12_FULL_48_16]OGE96779.1 MAG: hypothetical protein A2990_00505 [Candidatus Doudnabacteria bacterium RIFCSPLOWO2_01_FULL_49_40]OGF02856.1 MAG: hypothetical protein A3H14_00135 [Candid